jgi:acyl-CoA thioester hydrolase
MTNLPTFDEIAELPVLAESLVWRDQIDANGHMNILHYLAFDARGTTAVAEDVGVDDMYRATRRMGLFTAEHHLRYYAELHEGARVAVHVRVLERGENTAHLMAFLLDRDRERLSNTLELITVHVDLDTRRPTPMPRDIAAGFDRHVNASRQLGWPAPVCGAMGVRRPVAPLGCSPLPIGYRGC